MRKLCITSLALIGLLAGLVGYQLFNKKAPEVSKHATNRAALQAAVTRVEKSMPAGIAGKTPEPAATVNDGKPAPSLKLIYGLKRGAITDVAMLAILHRHPELKITATEAGDLQELYSAYYMQFARLQAELAHVTTAADGTTVIAIPEFAKLGSPMVKNLTADMIAYYNGNPPAGVTDAVIESFRNSTNSAGEIPMNFEVKASDEPGFVYEMTQRSFYIDPQTKRVTGTGWTTYKLQPSELAYSPYAELGQYFPKPKS